MFAPMHHAAAIPAGDGGPAPRSRWERALLSLLLRQGETASGAVARAVGCTAQTASVTARSLTADGLILKGGPVRGKVGKPQTPLRLNPDGAFALGLRIGRRRADMALIDLGGALRALRTVAYPYPTPDRVLAFAARGAAALREDLTPAQQARLVGVGVGAPFQLWRWLDIVGAPDAEMRLWRDLNLAQAVATRTGLPTTLANDASMACAAELQFGRGRRLRDFAYFYVSAFVGGGVVSDGRLYQGPGGNAGAFGSIPVGGVGGAREQLLHHASLYLLERALAQGGWDPDAVLAADAAWHDFGAPLKAWIETAAAALAQAGVAVTAVLDTPCLVIDGVFPPWVRAALTARVAERIAEAETSGVTPPQVVEGAMGRSAGAVGAAYQPIQRAFLASCEPRP